MTEHVNDALTIWRAYCDKKMELEDAQDEIERLQDQIYESVPKWQANELQREIEQLRTAVVAARREGIEAAIETVERTISPWSIAASDECVAELRALLNGGNGG